MSQTRFPEEFSFPVTSIHKVEADGVRVFYRAAGDPNAPVVLLLHGFPASSFMFRELIPRLAGNYRVRETLPPGQVTVAPTVTVDSGDVTRIGPGSNTTEPISSCPVAYSL